MVFGVAELYLYFSLGHLPAMHIKEEVATLATRRKNNYSDHSQCWTCSAGGYVVVQPKVQWHRAQGKALDLVLVIVLVCTLSRVSKRVNAVALGKTRNILTKGQMC